MPATETALPTFQEAYEKAKEEHSRPSEEVTAPETEGETETAKPVETEQPQAEDQSTEAAEDTESLLTKEEEAALKGEAAKQYKQMQRAFTQKTQKLSEERKKIEQWQTFIDSFQANPQETLKRLAGSYGLQVAEPEQQRMNTTVQEVADESVQQLREALGPEGTVLADRLAPVFENLARRIAQTVVKTEVDPIKEAQQRATAEAMAAEAESELEAFGKRHADWKEYESKIVELGKKFQPAQNSEMDTSEYLDMLYFLATKDRTDAATTKSVVDRLNKSVRAAAQETAGVSQKVVTPAAPKKPSFQEAWQAAKRGERWE